MMGWREAWEQLQNADTGNTTCDGCGIPVFGFLLPIVILIGIVGLIIKWAEYRSGKP